MRERTSRESMLQARTRLAALRGKVPETKAAKIRALWPEIQAALENGHSLKAVCECLEADGIAVSVQSLGSYVSRIRRQSIRRKSEPESAPAPMTFEKVQTQQTATESTSSPPKPAGDVLANVRERQRRRPGFDYRPELADPTKLI